jgi:hypothetical protein
MNKKLKKLQADYAAGKITKQQYQQAVKELLDAEEIDQEDHDKALQFQPEGDEDDDQHDKPIYTQADMDRAVLKKARSLVRKTLREAGVDLSDVSNADLLDTLVDRVKAGEGKEKVDDKQLTTLRKKAEKVDALEAKLQKLTIENAVLLAAGKYNPHNPAQVVRALQADYADLIEIDDETGEIDRKSVDRAIARLAKSEPNLFKQDDKGDEGQEGDEDGDNQNDQGSGSKSLIGKSPGGTGAAGNKSQKQEDKLLQEALEMLKIKKTQ